MLLETLDTLNDEQKAAVTHSGSPLLILAGAGSGKTRVITVKIAYMTQVLKIPPQSILALTFTKKAAAEMKERAIALSPDAALSQISTFHSFGAQFLRRNDTSALKLSPNFTIYDDTDSLSLLNQAAAASSDSDISRLDKKALKHYCKLISLCKDYGYLVGDFKAAIQNDNCDEVVIGAPLLKRSGVTPNELGSAFEDPLFLEVYDIYESALRKSGNVDFGDLINLPRVLMERDKALLERVRNHFSTILIDEYQDVNNAQVALIRQIVDDSKIYLCVVGDDDQSIYGFRGSEVSNILGFDKVFPGTQTIKLTKNYRSTQSILNVANSVIANNRDRLGKDMECAKGTLKELPPTLFINDTDRDEADNCIKIIKKGVNGGKHYSDYAILYRINAQSLLFEQALVKARIPYKVEGTLKFYDRQEVKDAIAYLALIANPHDTVAFSRVINTPPRHIGRATVDKIVDGAGKLGSSLLDYEALIKAVKLPKKTVREYMNFCTMMSGLKNKYLLRAHSVDDIALEKGDKSGRDMDGVKADGNSNALSTFITKLLTDSTLIDYYTKFDSEEGTNRVANIAQLVNTATPYNATVDGLTDWLNDMTLFAPPIDEAAGDGSGTPRDHVTLITVHNTKGLEYPIVILTGLEEGIFPLYKSGVTDIEEERRLFYVAATRAMDELFLSYCKTRLYYGRLQYQDESQFIFEANLIDANSSTPYNKWKCGVEVYHDDYGGGIVTACKRTGREVVVTVQFQDGRIMRFLPEYQSNNLTIVGE